MVSKWDFITKEKKNFCFLQVLWIEAEYTFEQKLFLHLSSEEKKRLDSLICLSASSLKIKCYITIC